MVPVQSIISLVAEKVWNVPVAVWYTSTPVQSLVIVVVVVEPKVSAALSFNSKRSTEYPVSTVISKRLVPVLLFIEVEVIGAERFDRCRCCSDDGPNDNNGSTKLS